MKFNFKIMIQVTRSDFQKEVIEASITKPVLIDFWAEWCAPCRMLSPLLEKLEKHYNGKWKLVKINTDYEPELAMQYKVTGIPHCVLFKDGEAVDSFTGALPEIHIRKFLDKHIPNEESKKILELLKSIDYNHFKEGIERAIETKITNNEINSLIWNHMDKILKKNEIDLLKKVLNFFVENNTEFASSSSSLKEYIKKFESEEDFKENFEKILELNNHEKQREILEYFYNKIEKNIENKHKLKDHLINCFIILGQNHPLSNEYRKKLSRLLY